MKIRIGPPKNCFNAGQDLGDKVNCLKEKIPQVEWDPNVIWGVLPKGKEVHVSFKDKVAKLKIVRETSKLRGTKIWVSEELTPTQLKQRST